MRNSADNLSKMSNKTYSEAVIGQFKSMFRKRTNIPPTNVTKVYLLSQPLPPRSGWRSTAATERPSGAPPERTPKFVAVEILDVPPANQRLRRQHSLLYSANSTSYSQSVSLGTPCVFS